MPGRVNDDGGDNSDGGDDGGIAFVSAGMQRDMLDYAHLTGPGGKEILGERGWELHGGESDSTDALAAWMCAM